MLWLGFIAPFFVIWYPVKWVFSYYLVLVFLGLGLRPLLEKTGLLDSLHRIRQALFAGKRKKLAARRAAEIAQKERQKALRYSHQRSDELPPRW
jgi:hypothetical protein